ncbi:neprilysin-like, partial [Asbolus verrucosus]
CTNYYGNRICTSEECLRSAANLRLSLDFSVDPCDDFYKYTCGRWSEEHPNHGWFPSFSAFSTISERILIAIENFLTSEEEEDEPLSVKQTRSFYKSCMDLVYKYLQEVGLPQIPSLLTKTDEEIADFKFDWLKADAVIKKTFAMDVLIGFGVDANIYNRSENVMYIGVPGQRCPLPSPFKNKNKKVHKTDGKETDFEELRKTANTNIIKFVLTTVIKNATSEEPKEDLLQQATEVLLNMTLHVDELITNFTDFSEDPHPQAIKEYQTKTNELLINNLNKDYPEIWQKYISYLFDGVNVTINFDKDVFYLGDSDDSYLPKIIGYVLTTSDIYLELYMWWVTVFAMIINTSSDVVEYILKQTAPFYTGSAVLRSRSLDCSSLVNSFMGMAVSYGVADRTFSNKTKPKVEQMLYDIKNAFVEHVNSLNWMDKETKEATLEKSKEMISFIGYPEWLFQKGALDVYYKGIVVNNDTYLENMMAFIKSYMPSKFEDLRTINQRNWSTDPTTVNAFNSFPDNAISVSSDGDFIFSYLSFRLRVS